LIVQAKSYWDRAVKTFHSAGALCSSDQDRSASCSYYAAFYAVSALFALEAKGFTRHSAVETAVHRDLVKPGKWPVDLGQAYSNLCDTRNTGDYGGEAHVSEEEARQAIDAARHILEAVHRENPEMFPLYLE
jgi:uncharacterized protein (UPF0332 family)